MTKANKVLFITQEITPYVPETEMSLTGRHLPQAIQELGREIRTFMPKWGNINERRNQLHEVIRLSGMNLIIDDTDHPLIIKVASIQSARMQVYFIDNDDYFISALAPLYIKKAYKEEPSFRDAKVVFSLYEEDFKQPFHPDYPGKLLLKGVNKKDLTILKDPIDYTTLCKLAVEYSDGVIQQSQQINPEILEYAKTLGKPVLEYQSPDSFAEACNNFYDRVAGEEL